MIFWVLYFGDIFLNLTYKISIEKYHNYLFVLSFTKASFFEFEK